MLIDVRTPQEYMFEHIEGALLMPMAFFDAKKLPGQSDKRIVLHCGSGVRSEKMAKTAIEAGFDRIAHLDGGFGAWKAGEEALYRHQHGHRRTAARDTLKLVVCRAVETLCLPYRQMPTSVIATEPGHPSNRCSPVYQRNRHVRTDFTPP